MIKKFIALSLIGLFGICFISAGSSSGLVSNSVQPSFLGLTITDGSVAWGTLSLGATSTTISLGESQTITNLSTEGINLAIKGSDSNSWALTTSTPTTDEFQQDFSFDNLSSTIALTTNYNSGVETLSQDSTTTLDFALQMPTGSSVNTAQTWNIDILGTSE